MSKETLSWLNNFTLVGFTDKRGRAWHYRENEQGTEPNHYPLAVPVADVRRRLFGWKTVEGDVQSTGFNEDGVFTIKADDRKAMLRPPGALGPHDTGAIMGLFKSGYRGHDYDEWLVRNVESIISDELACGSAGLLAQGAQAWVSIEVPENITTPEGVVFRPNLLATTSFDGSLATTYKRVVTNVVCDNTMAAGLGERGQQVKVKHSKNSLTRLTDVRAALAIVHTIADDFAAEVSQLANTTVSDDDWAKFLDELAPLKVDGEDKTGRALTLAENKRSTMSKLWNHDERVSPWRNTAWGVVQAVNTYVHHEQTVRGSERAERNMSLAVTGGFDKLDAETMATLTAVMS